MSMKNHLRCLLNLLTSRPHTRAIISKFLSWSPGNACLFVFLCSLVTQSFDSKHNVDTTSQASLDLGHSISTC